MTGARRLLRGHYNPVNWTRKYPNLQYAKIDGVRAKICTQCMKTIHKVRAPKKTAATTASAAAVK